MKLKINSYIAVLFVTVAGAFATLLILHAVTSTTLAAGFQGSEAGYASLQDTILNH